MSSDAKKPLGKVPLQQKVVEKKELEAYLGKQKQSSGPLGPPLDREEPQNQAALLKALSLQHGIPAINLDDIVIQLDVLRLVPKEIAMRSRILPFMEKDEHLFLAMADPHNHRIVEEIEFVTGKKVFRYVALERSLAEATVECYRLREMGKSLYRGKNVSNEKYLHLLWSLGITEALTGEAEEEEATVPPAPAQGVAPGIAHGLGPVGADTKVAGSVVPERLEASTSQEVPEAFEEEIDFSILEEDGPPHSQGAHSSPRILVVDDEEDILNLISKVLRENRYTVTTATNGREALMSIKKSPPDLLILDAMLPEIHGFEICKRLSGSAKYGHIPVIMISAIYRGWRFAQDLKNSYGVDVFMEKPFKIQDLLKNVAMILNKQSSGRAETDRKEMSKEARLHLEASAAAYRKGDTRGAIEHLKAAIQIDPLSPQLHFNLALVYGKAGMTYYAISELETVLEIDPTMFSAMKNLAILYQEAGFKNKAIEMWERALSVCNDEESKLKIKEHLMTML